MGKGSVRACLCGCFCVVESEYPMLLKTFEIFISDTLLPFSLSLFSPLALLFLLPVYFFCLLLDYSVKTVFAYT